MTIDGRVRRDAIGSEAFAAFVTARAIPMAAPMPREIFNARIAGALKLKAVWLLRTDEHRRDLSSSYARTKLSATMGDASISCAAAV